MSVPSQGHFACSVSSAGMRKARRSPYVASLTLVLMLVACHQTPPSCPNRRVPSTEGSAPFGQIWVATRINVDGVSAIDPQVARPFFDVPNSYVIEGWDVWPWASASQRTAYWASEAEFEKDVRSQGGGLPGVQAVLYDPEAWAATPMEEQRDPAAAMQRFADLGRELGYKVVITPGLTLPSVGNATCGGNPDEDAYDAYLRCNIAGTAAKYADVVEVQAQTLQGEPDRYLDFTKKAAVQIRSSNPNAMVISGLRVRNEESLDDVKRTWLATLNTVDGYYLAMTPSDAAALLGWISSCAAPPSS